MKEKTLIVVTGITGSGKTTLANALGTKLHIRVESLDSQKEENYDLYGFSNLYERRILDDMSKLEFKADLVSSLRCGSSIIIEHPFSKRWQKFFQKICSEYGYKLVIINCNTRDFEEIWRAKLERDESSVRHPAHLARFYMSKTEYETYNADSKLREARNYYNNYYNSLSGDEVYTDKEIIKMYDLKIS